MAQEEKISVIAAIGRDRAIGKDNALLWRIPDDLKRFKQLTDGHPVIMGRKTWESLPEKFRPLPGRANIVITRDSEYEAPGAVLAQSFPEALSLARDAEGSEEIFAIGGQWVYECALPFASRLYLTVIDDQKEGDAFFPRYEEEFTKEVAREEREHEGLHYALLDLERG
jgi:dihydrofolate reductase